MTPTLIAITTLIYLGVGVSSYFDGRVGMSVTFVGYAIANLGLIYDSITRGH